MDWLKGLLSASFSVPRCSRPMCGSALMMVSPSISSTRRSTPCAAGCCGPKFSVKLRMSATAAVLQFRLVAAVVADHARHQRALDDLHRLVHHALLVGVVAHFDIAHQREVLAEWMPDEAVVSEDAAQVRMAVEHDAEQVEGLALEPVGGSVDTNETVERGLLAFRAVGAQRQALVMGHRQQLVEHRETRAIMRAAMAFAVHAAAETTVGGCDSAPLAAPVIHVVDAGNVDQDLEVQ